MRALWLEYSIQVRCPIHAIEFGVPKEFVKGTQPMLSLPYGLQLSEDIPEPHPSKNSVQIPFLHSEADPLAIWEPSAASGL